MSTTAPGQSAGSALLALIQNDALLAFAQPLLTFLTNAQAAAGDPIKLTAAVVQLQGDLVGHAPSALAGLEAQIAGVLASKLQAAIAKAAAATALQVGSGAATPPAEATFKA